MSIKNQTYTYLDFLEFINKNLKSIKKEWPTSVVVKKQYETFLEKSVFKYKEENLENENQEFSYILNEYREGLLLFELMQDKIWEGAKNDSIGLQEFYNLNKQNYIWPDRIEGSVARSSDKTYIKKVRKYWAKNQSNKMIDEALNKEQQNVIFSNGIPDSGFAPFFYNPFVADMFSQETTFVHIWAFLSKLVHMPVVHGQQGVSWLELYILFELHGGALDVTPRFRKTS